MTQHLGPQAVRDGRGARHRRRAARKTRRRTASSIDVGYSDATGKPVRACASCAQGSDLIAQITVRNISKRRLDNLALTQMVPAGWEIRNERLEDVGDRGRTHAGRAAQHRFWWVPGWLADAIMRSAEYIDIRDDRVHALLQPAPGESIFFETRLNAAYLGRFYLPGAGIEAMYDAKQHARQKGQWVEVVPAGK